MTDDRRSVRRFVLGCLNYPKTMIHIENTIDISEIIDHLTDKERLEWIKELVESLQEEGSIGKVRQLVTRPIYDDN